MTGQLEIVHLTTDGKKTDGNTDINKKAKTNPSDVLKAFAEKKPMFIEFYANFCGHCKTLEKEWEKLIEMTEKDTDVKNISIVSIESDVVNKEISKMKSDMHINVSGFPTIGAIVNNKFIPYEGSRDAKSMLAFIKADILNTKQRGGGRPVKRRTVKRRTVKRRTVKRRIRWIKTTRPKRTRRSRRIRQV